MDLSDEIAIDFIIDLIRRSHGYDFRHYSKASLKRRFLHYKTKHHLDTLADMIPVLLNDPQQFNDLLSDISITVTEMFRDPEFYRSFANIVIPKLKTYPYVKIWHAGCATGEEVYSMEILLEENNYLERAQLYATDFNPYALELAKKGIYSKERYPLYEKNYQESMGKFSLAHYFIKKYEALKIKRYLQKNVTFSQHNLATDKMFSEVEVVICRNVMIYFNKKLKNRVFKLFYESLTDHGFLCLGTKETVNFPGFKCLDPAASIYQKVSSNE